MTLFRAVLVALAIVMVALQYRLWVGQNSLAHVSSLTDRAERLAVENKSKRERNKILRAEIIDLKSGTASIEEKARTDFGLIKEGETFFLLVEDEPAHYP